jgi:D-glycero-alpha-D-manno-heptose-7-phosphate kinase
MIITRTPYRISLFGGGTDYPAWYKVHGGAVMSFAINKYCYISLRYLPQFFEHKYRFVYSLIENVQSLEEIKHPAIRGVLQYLKWTGGIEVHHDGDLPARSGIASSSAFTVGFLNALNALKGCVSSKYDLASLAIHIEQEVLGEAVGCQDQVIVSYGGINRIDFPKQGAFQVSPLVLDEGRIKALESRLLLFFTGISRYSSDIAASQISSIPKNEKQLTKIFDLVNQGILVLESGSDIDLIGEILHESWMNKKELSPLISNPEIDSIYQGAMESGAIGGKLLGAGGGGFILFWAHPDNHERIIKKLRSYIHVPIKIDYEGSRLALYQPEGI